MTERRFFLDVKKSALGLGWVHRLDPRQENLALAISQSNGVPDIVARILAGRGVEQDEATSFLDPTIRELLPDPRSFTDMDVAANRLVDAIVAKEKVAIFGDYDVDGAASSALLQRFLKYYGLETEIYIPDRIFEGYGPNPDAMRELVSRGASLIVTVDCGTNSAAAIDAANESGATVVVLDHHQVGGDLPAALAVVNPNRDDDISGQGHLCAAGVVFMTLVHISSLLRVRNYHSPAPDLLAMLDLVALATVCDVVPLIGVNRAFVIKGLLAMRKLGNVGITALSRVSRIGEPLNPYHLGYIIGPRINAGGRIGNAALGSHLLATDDESEATKIAETLDRLNSERQAMEQEMLVQAKAEADAELVVGDGPAVIVTANDKWHAGIVGILAARLKEHARRPAFAISFNPNGIGTGSGRSITGFDLGRMVREAVSRGLLIKGGGHAMAAGITLQKENLGQLRAFFEEWAIDEVSRLRDGEAIEVDAAVAADGVNFNLLDAIEKAGPYGSGHPQPVIALPRHTLADARLVGQNHMRLDLRSQTGARIQAMAFRVADTPLGDFLFANNGRAMHFVGNISSNWWNGSRSIQFKILDAALA